MNGVAHAKKKKKILSFIHLYAVITQKNYVHLRNINMYLFSSLIKGNPYDLSMCSLSSKRTKLLYMIKRINLGFYSHMNIERTG